MTGRRAIRDDLQALGVSAQCTDRITSRDGDPKPTRTCEGCGVELPSSPAQRRYCSRACGVRARRRLEPELERYRREVFNALTAGLIDRYDAIALLVSPSPRVIERLQRSTEGGDGS